MLNIVADENIPGLDALLHDVARVVYLPGRSISCEHLRAADILLVRSVTRVDAALLEGTPVRFVGTCTIGTDHVDEAWLAAQGIGFASAPGCNAEAVVDYVLAALFAVFPDVELLRQKTTGIVGIGQVGGRLFGRLQKLGIPCIAHDPFKTAAGASLDDILACDIISLHVPYTLEGVHATHHLLDARNLSRLKAGSLLINTSRGPVVDNEALEALMDRQAMHVVLDVYEDEPAPDIAFMRKLDIATAHIAGYSLQGKIRGSAMVVESLFAFFGIRKQIPDLLAPLTRKVVFSGDAVGDLLREAYDIRSDSALFLQSYGAVSAVEDRRSAFDAYRKHYPVRYEWGFTEIQASCVDTADLINLGFRKNKRA